MTVTIEFSPHVETGLLALAKAQALTLPQSVQYLLRMQVSIETSKLSLAERAAVWRDSVRDISLTSPLSDSAISRDSIYGDRG